MVSRGKVVITGAFIGLGLFMLYLVYYASLDNPELEKTQVDLVNVKVLDVNSVDNRATLEVKFLITNPGKKSITVSQINYALSVNGKDVGNGNYNTEDISLPGRAAIYAGQSVELTSKFNLVYNNQIADAYSTVTNNELATYKANGIISVESAWSIVEKQFETTLG